MLVRTNERCMKLRIINAMVLPTYNIVFSFLFKKGKKTILNKFLLWLAIFLSFL